MEYTNMKLEMATTKMTNIFHNDNKFIVLKDAIKNIESEISKSITLAYLDSLNLIVNAFVSMMEECEFDENFIVDYFCDFYKNFLHVRIPNSTLLEDYNRIYIEKFKHDLLDYWNELKRDTSLKPDGRSFIKTFDEIHDYALIKFSKLFTKEAKSLTNLYRCARGEHYANYERLFPNDDYAKDNRWNHPDKAYLYVGYGENNCSIDEINNIKKTCFEEIRLQEGEYATLCKFKIINNCKLLNLCIDYNDVEMQNNELDKSLEMQINQLLENKKFMKKAKNLAKQGKNIEIKKEIEWKSKTNRNMVEKFVAVHLISSIVDAIFVPIDIETDPALETYIPFRLFADYLKSKNYGGIIYKSTRMDLLEEHGKNIVIFEKSDSATCDNTMELYKRENGQDIKVCTTYIKNSLTVTQP